jgi:hypothetical protein
MRVMVSAPNNTIGTPFTESHAKGERMLTEAPKASTAPENKATRASRTRRQASNVPRKQHKEATK